VSLELFGVNTSVMGVSPDQHEACEAWAEAGECENNAGFMMTGCATACDRAQNDCITMS
jgi:hypothetical protein